MFWCETLLLFSSAVVQFTTTVLLVIASSAGSSRWEHLFQMLSSHSRCCQQGKPLGSSAGNAISYPSQLQLTAANQLSACNRKVGVCSISSELVGVCCTSSSCRYSKKLLLLIALGFTCYSTWIHGQLISMREIIWLCHAL